MEKSLLDKGVLILFLGNENQERIEDDASIMIIGEGLGIEKKLFCTFEEDLFA